MVRQIKAKLSPNIAPGAIFSGISGIPKDIQVGIIKDIFPKMEKEMVRKIESWPGSGSKGISVADGFEYTKNPRENGVLMFMNVSNHAAALIEGVEPHFVPIRFIADWAREMGFQNKYGKLPSNIFVGGSGSRIQKGASQRNFWTPVVEKYFGTDGIASETITNRIYIGLKKRIK